MLIYKQVQRGILKYFQDKMGVKGYTTNTKRNGEKPYFYLQAPRIIRKTENLTSLWNLTVHGVLFCEDEEAASEILPALEQWLVEDDLKIQCVDKLYNPLPGCYLEEVELTYNQVEKDIVAFSFRGEIHTVKVVNEGEPLRVIYSNKEVKNG